MKKLTTLLAVSGMILALASAAQAQVTTTPQDTYRGPYRLGFYTTSTYPAVTNDITWYDARISDAAATVPELVALSNLTWKCMGSTTNVDARDNTGTNPTNPAHADVPIYNLNGVRITHGNAGLWEDPWTLDGPFTDELGVSATGLGDDGIKIFTGTLRDGTKSLVSGRAYLGWSVDAQTGIAGSKMDIDAAFGEFRWINTEANGQTDASRLLALSSVIEGGPIGTMVELK